MILIVLQFIELFEHLVTTRISSKNDIHRYLFLRQNTSRTHRTTSRCCSYPCPLIVSSRLIQSAPVCQHLCPSFPAFTRPVSHLQTHQALCHCSDCRKLTSCPYSNNLIVPTNAFTITSGSPKEVAKTADSGTAIRNYFCGDCGKHYTFPILLYSIWETHRVER
jgi:hypothetical protein